ncbi:hypothetical protein [Erythrobacter dokdonensis]|uniref:Uncharacterized protein n=1 Tax=Erythrobacter dokdonensis DSW-74 TaxID=1300349 RepID=A0A1A7BFS0_9SPHN|nr:hypothetical protein [Erythrobacter dokdonensis]OBV11373.1 hypothetical protein I603_0816 [Erythrobacter dokdonensis DSW-74]
MSVIYRANVGEGNKLLHTAIAKKRMIVWTYADLIPLIEADADENAFWLKMRGGLDTNLKPVDMRACRRGRGYDLELKQSPKGAIWTTYSNGQLWWTELIDEPALKWEPAETHVPERTGEQPIVHMYRQTSGWSDQDRRGRPLNNLHPRAVQIVSARKTFDKARASEPFFRALIDGDDNVLAEYYADPEWQKAAKERGWRPRPDNDEQIKRDSENPDEASAIARAIMQTVRGANGQSVQTTVKAKDTDMSEAELQRYIEELLRNNPDRRCALTGMTMQRYGSGGEFAVSPDRIDSKKGYVRGNIQLVCWFANRWKRDTPDAEMRATLAALRDHWETDKLALAA